VKVIFSGKVVMHRWWFDVLRLIVQFSHDSFGLAQLHCLIYETEVLILLLKVSIYMPSLKVVKNVIERMKNLSSFLVSGWFSWFLSSSPS